MKKYIIIIAIVAILIIAIFGITTSSKEKFEQTPIEVTTEEPTHVTETKLTDTPIQPKIYDAGSGTIMDGPDLVPSKYLSPWYQAYTGNLKNYFLLDDGKDGMAGLQYNQCSKSCCSDQYPLPFKMPVDSNVCASKDEFVPTNYMCNNAWQDTGCICLTKEQANFLGSRGGNA